FRLPRGLEGQAFDVKLHRTLGAYAALVLLVSAMASWTMTFNWARQLVYDVTLSSPPEKKPRAIKMGRPAGGEALLSRTLQVVPDAETITIVYPRKAGDPVEVSVIERDAPHPNARTMLYLDPVSAGTLRYEPYSASSPGYKVYRWLVSLHMGYVGGLLGQTLLFCAMATIPVLALTGMRSWIRRRRRQRSPI
ncbi:MAG: PepSY-associated TM helix domain-containing protein, partial [Pseudomonadota bacterium]